MHVFIQLPCPCSVPGAIKLASAYLSKREPLLELDMVLIFACY